MANTTPLQECCMCGDYGLSSQLFSCKLCQFRSQHRYCSNEYPKAETYMVCNWCLSQPGNKARTSPNSSSSSKNITDRDETLKKKNDHGLKDERGDLQLKIIKPIKKQRSVGRKRITTIGILEERRSKSTDLSKHVFKSKVTRYKFLDEVSTP